GAWALLQVRDRGMGIPADELPRIFERFFRGRQVAGQIPGSGLGLAGVKQIVEQHGGPIDVQSAEGAGSTFTVRLPLEPAAAGAQFRRFIADHEQLLALATALAVRQAEDTARLETALAGARRSYLETVAALAAAVEARDPYTAGHVERCGRLCRRLAAALGRPEDEQRLAELAGALH